MTPEEVPVELIAAANRAQGHGLGDDFMAQMTREIIAAACTLHGRQQDERIEQLTREARKWKFAAEGHERNVARMSENVTVRLAANKATLARVAVLLDNKRKTLSMQALRLALNPAPGSPEWERQEQIEREARKAARDGQNDAADGSAR